jgi:hypothetical protein
MAVEKFVPLINNQQFVGSIHARSAYVVSI